MKEGKKIFRQGGMRTFHQIRGKGIKKQFPHFFEKSLSDREAGGNGCCRVWISE
jgi:hypothetical protein